MNRVAILETLRTELARAQELGTELTVMLADLEHFKQVNDTYGHLAGDEVLRETAERMQACLRSHDAVGRYGAGEFLIVMPQCNASVAASRAEELRAAVSSTPVDTSEGAVPISISLGVTICGGDIPIDMEHLIRSTYEALYLAKSAGRNQFVVSEVDEERLTFPLKTFAP